MDERSADQQAAFKSCLVERVADLRVEALAKPTPQGHGSDYWQGVEFKIHQQSIDVAKECSSRHLRRCLGRHPRRLSAERSPPRPACTAPSRLWWAVRAGAQWH